MTYPDEPDGFIFLYYCRVKMIRDIRRFFGAFDLKRKSKQVNRNKRIHNFTTAGTAGIIFNCCNEEEFNAVKEFREFLESESIKTDVIGYVSAKEIPDHYLLRTGYNFFCQKDLTWYYKPDIPFAEEFMRKEFDILFDLSLKEFFPLNYILKISPAAYKIGPFRELEPYDLMIDIKEERTVSFLISQIRHYLSILHTRS